MESKRFILALALSVMVIFAMQFIIPGANPNGAKGAHPADSSAVAQTNKQNAAPVSVTQPNAAVASADTAVTPAPQTATVSPTPSAAPIVADTTIIAAQPDSGAAFKLSDVGAVPVSVVMQGYKNRVYGGQVDLSAAAQPILRYELVTGKATPPVDLSRTKFQASSAGNVVTYQAQVAGKAVAVRYTVAPDSFVAHVTGTIAGAGDGSYLMVNLPTTFVPTEPDTADDRNYLAYAYMARHEAARNVPFHSLDPGEKKLVEGPLTWIAAKSKYFVVALLAPEKAAGFTEARLIGGSRTSKVATTASGAVLVPVKNGTFAFDIYAGPQEYTRLAALGRNFDEVNPYGWAFMRSIMQPIAASVILAVLWMHHTLHLSYGWVLIALGLLVRILMWPLYQSSMRTSLKMQVLQPELQAVQEKYKEEPEKQRAEVMKVYQAHGMSPLSPLLGCLPSLLPWPVLLALFFVFKNTIEFRGVPFLWLTDLSAKDPYYILPLIMGVSMYLVSWIGMRAAPPNAQTKMMSYAMPVMFTFFFLKAAAGLNIYYATQNLASLPQQWHLAHERKKLPATGSAQVKGKQVQAAVTKGSGGRKKRG